MSSDKPTPEKYAALIPTALGLAIFFWSALFAFQGLDFTDLGFSLVTYQQFYSAPETNAYFMLNWLTGFIGHWVGETLGGTVLAYNLSASLTFALTGVIAYFGLQLVFGRSWTIASSVFIAFLFSTKANENWISYNNLTALFFTAGAVMLLYGLYRERLLWVVIAGCILGANLFIRFPNLLGIGLVLAVVLHGFSQRWPWKKRFNWSVAFVGGYFIGIFLTAMLLMLHGHTEMHLQSVQGIFVKAVDDSSTHSGSMLIRLFLRDHLYALVLATLVMSAGLAMLRFITQRAHWISTLVVVVCALLLAVAFGVIESWKWAVPGILYFGLLWIAFKEWQPRPQVALLAFLALSILILVPLGSSNGIRNATYGHWLALPLLLAWLWKGGPDVALPLVSLAPARRLAATTLGLTLITYSLVSSWFYSYRDSSNRLTLTHAINHPLLAGTRTTAERAQVVGQLLDAVRNWVKPGDIVLAYPSMPTFHFVTETRSWLDNPWPVLYGSTEIERRLAKKKAELALPPIVVRSLGDTRNRVWPVNFERDKGVIEAAAEASLDRFVQDSGYTVVWANDFFEILARKQQ